MKAIRLKLYQEGTLKEMLESGESFGWDLHGEGEPLSDITLDSCQLSGIDFSEKKAEFSSVDCRFLNCDLSNLDLSRHSFFRTHFVDCKLLGTDFSSSRFVDCSFERCKIQYANFSETEMKDCQMADSECTRTFFHRFTQKNLKLKNVDLSGCEFLESDLRELDISTCKINETTFQIKSVNGLTVNTDQAVALSTLMGLVVKD